MPRKKKFGIYYLFNLLCEHHHRCVLQELVTNLVSLIQSFVEKATFYSNNNGIKVNKVVMVDSISISNIYHVQGKLFEIISIYTITV